ncbi:hypothetical protein GH714_019465 [Hevea brasiliensis]|uniref:Uncharacterized protein n=1 Tax=Hevea brasiliensis TaxID=3981 RepID=A0A6A6N6N0_HEVBR|nr:hypothetical protein GH714_019465 [Hevea brasiliensis]
MLQSCCYGFITLLNLQETHFSSLNYLILINPFDSHTISPVAILYGACELIVLGNFMSHWLKLPEQGRIKYVVRPVLPSGCEEKVGNCGTVGAKDSLNLGGYGVELALKNMEYKAMDDSAIKKVLGHSQTQFYVFKLLRFSILKLSNLSYARYVFDHVCFPNIYLCTAMVTAYASKLDHLSAFEIYRNMVRRRHPKPNHFIFPHVLKSCQTMKLVHAQIAKSGFGQYPVVQTALVDSYSRSSSDIGFARQLFDEMSEKNVVSWTAMISGKMMLLAQATQHRHIRPNQVTVVCVLSACANTGMLQLGKCIHGYVYRNSLGSDSFMSNALVDMYGKCGSLREARRVFDMTLKKSLTSWNSMINCFALHGHGRSAICIFEEMMQHGEDVRPDEVTFVGLLNACTHGGLVEKGRYYFLMMTQNYGIEPQIEHYGCLIDILGRAGKFEEALEVVRGMKIEPDEVVWGSLLNGCKVHGHTDLAEFAVKKLIEIDPKNGGYG